ncbi:MAG TPA: hypothetical protein VG962_08735 [Steroidobacteraceae bacterium]|nr:hypothetical protein [Steroidobacteraceae bacterium]
MSVATDNDAERRQRIRRNALWLTLLALGFYAGFILLSVSRAHG